MSTAAAAFFQERRAEFEAAAAMRALSDMRRGARLHLQYRGKRPLWSLVGKSVSANVAAILTQHALVKPVDDALFNGMPAQSWEYVK